MFNYLALLHSGIELASPDNAHADGELLARGCISQLKQLDQQRFPPKLLILLASSEYIETGGAQKLLDGVHDEFSEARFSPIPLIGCSVAAVFFDRQVHAKGALLICLASRLLEVEVAMTSVLRAEPEDAARTILQNLSLDRDLGEDLNPFANRTLFAFLPGNRPEGYIAAKLHECLRERLWARVPIVGGVSSGYAGEGFPAGLQFANREVNKNLLVAACVTSRTTWGMSISDNLERTRVDIRVDELGKDPRIVKKFDGKPAATVIRDLLDTYKFVALGKRSFNGEPIIELPLIEGNNVRLLRGAEVRDSFRVLGANPENAKSRVHDSVERSIKAIGLQNPIACLGFKCSGYFASCDRFPLDLTREIVQIEELLGPNGNFVGGFVDGEAGKDVNGRSQIRSWSTAAIVFGDELRHRTAFQEAFEQLSDFLNRDQSQYQSLEDSINALVKMIYTIGFPGVRLLLKVEDHLAGALVVPSSAYAVGSLALTEADGSSLSISLGTDDNPSTAPAAIVLRSRKPKFFSYEGVETGAANLYFAPLKDISYRFIAVLQIDVGFTGKMRPFQEDLLAQMATIAGAILTRVFNYQETMIRVKLQEAYTQSLDAEELEHGLQQYLEGALQALGLRMGHIRLADLDFKLQLVAGAGDYYDLAQKERPTVSRSDSTPTAKTFSSPHRNNTTIINDAQHDSAHLGMVAEWESHQTNAARQIAAILKGVRSYANIKFRSKRFLPTSDKPIEGTVSLIASDKPIEGTISLLAEEPWHFKYPQKRVLQTITLQIESLIDHLDQKSAEKMAHQEVRYARDRETRARKLAELAFRLSLTPLTGRQTKEYFQTTINAVLERFCTEIAATVGSIYLWDNDRSLYVLRAFYKWSNDGFLNNATYTEDSGWFGVRALNGAPEHIEDLWTYYRNQDDAKIERTGAIPGGRYASKMFGEPLAEASNVEVIGLPLSVGTKKLGVMALYRPLTTGSKSGFNETILPVSPKSPSGLMLTEAASSISGLIDTLLQHEDDTVESDEQSRRTNVSDQLSQHIEEESEGSFPNLICTSVAQAYHAAKARLYQVSWDREEIKSLDLIASDPNETHEVTPVDRYLIRAIKNYVQVKSGSEMAAENLAVKRKSLDQTQRNNLQQAALEGLVERACLPIFLKPGHMWFLDLRWDIGESRNYCTEAHLRNKYLKQLSDDLSKFSRLAIQTRKRIEAERDALAQRKEQQVLLGKVGVMAQMRHHWKKSLRKLTGRAITFRNENNGVDALETLATEITALYDQVSQRLEMTFQQSLIPRPQRLEELIGNTRKDSFLSRNLGHIIPSIIVPQNLYVMAAPVSMEVTFENLIHNAIVNAEPKAPYLSIVASLDPESNLVQIRFTNNGKQISAKICDGINNGEYDTSEGWGLVIAACFAAYDNGSLKIERPANGNTVVVLSLPAAVERGR